MNRSVPRSTSALRIAALIVLWSSATLLLAFALFIDAFAGWDYFYADFDAFRRAEPWALPWTAMAFAACPVLSFFALAAFVASPLPRVWASYAALVSIVSLALRALLVIFWHVQESASYGATLTNLDKYGLAWVPPTLHDADPYVAPVLQSGWSLGLAPGGGWMQVALLTLLVTPIAARTLRPKRPPAIETAPLAPPAEHPAVPRHA